MLSPSAPGAAATGVNFRQRANNTGEGEEGGSGFDADNDKYNKSKVAKATVRRVSSASLLKATKISKHQSPFWKPAFWFLTFVSMTTRLYGLSEPHYVAWDETHFGKFASHYIKREFFFDVHPPLGKMMLACAGVLSGYDGKFTWEKPGHVFDEDTHYYGMRFFVSLMGAFVPLCTFGIMGDLGFSLESALIAGLIIALDCGTATLSRFILLDSILMFFISFSVW